MAVARSLFKLMAYKDEYEVARLYTDGSFRQQLREQFEDGYTLRFHMAPPLLARKDPHTGIPRKLALGPAAWPAMRVLARLKGLRGTWLDPFGHSAERRMERQLIQEYLQTVETLLEHLSPANLVQAAGIAALPEQVRGFGHVKVASVTHYRQRLEQMLQHYGPSGSPTVSARKSA
jgi:indolepyruvate ferredoxin oxidoreductase